MLISKPAASSSGVSMPCCIETIQRYQHDAEDERSEMVVWLHSLLPLLKIYKVFCTSPSTLVLNTLTF
jgi:hypothetical protein